jgi:hypothetical protein
MAIAYFVREGAGEERTTQGQEIPLSEIVNAYPKAKAIWSASPPILNPETSINPVAAYRFVVICVKGETDGQFTKDGCWLLDRVTPADFRKRFPSA